MKNIDFLIAFLFYVLTSEAQNELLMNTFGRKTISLNGTWHYIIDPYETGFYDYRFKERPEGDPGAYWNKPVIKTNNDWTEHSFKEPYTIQVPGDWNHQDPKFLYYEGTVWYQRTFDKPQLNENEEVHLYFGAVNYKADVYLNGKKLVVHKGGFTPFNFIIPKGLLQEKDNNLVVHVNNNRHPDDVPTVNTDWWNYGGITRDVKLVITSKQHIRQYHLQLDPEQDIAKAKRKGRFKLKGWVKFNTAISDQELTIEIPEVKFKESVSVEGNSLQLDFEVKNIELWDTKNPKLYDVNFSLNKNTITDKIGFRTVKVEGTDILLNGEKTFLRGICLHEEIAKEERRAYSKTDAEYLLGQVQELHANMVRLAHYPHNEYMPRVADSLGIMLWTEIPVYWTINFDKKEVLDNAKQQLNEMVNRDRNRASIVLWGVGNETPVSDKRTEFMTALVKEAKALDQTRLVAAALEVGYNKGKNHVDDPLGEFTDIVALNEYLGWYVSTPDGCRTAEWSVKYDKPFFISETGAGAKGGFHADKTKRFSEEYQQWLYEEQINMFKTKFPESFSGLTPWILFDFKSPKRKNPVYQENWNRKGLIDEKGNKKLAFYTLQAYYKELEELENNR